MRGLDGTRDAIATDMLESRLLVLALVPLLATGCADDGSSAYHVATCSFGSAATTCTPIRVPDSPRDWFELSFTVIDPNPGVPAGCAGTVELEVNTAATGSGQLRWHSQELDAATCAEVGQPVEGSGAIEGGRIVDLAFPQAGFTFRVDVSPTDDPVADPAN